MDSWVNLLIFIISTLITAIISGFIGGKITLFLTNRKEKKESRIRFTNRLKTLAFELKINFSNCGTAYLPFHTRALEKLVYDEPIIHTDPELFQKANTCLNIAQTLSTAQPYHPTLRSAYGQQLMKELADYILNKYRIKGEEHIPFNLRTHPKSTTTR